MCLNGSESIKSMLDLLTGCQSKVVSICAGRCNVRLAPTDYVRAFAAGEAGTLREVFCVGMTAVVNAGWPVAAPRRWRRRCDGEDVEMHRQDIVLPVVGGVGSLHMHSGSALWIFRKDVLSARGAVHGYDIEAVEQKSYS